MNSLFRKEVIESQYNNVLGDVLISQPLPYRILFYFLLLILLIIFTVMSVTSLSRKENVKGRLNLSSGIIKLYSKEFSIVSRVYISEGQEVKKGQALFELKRMAIDRNGNDAFDMNSKELEMQIELLNIEKKQKINLEEIKRKELLLNLSELVEKLHTIEEQKSQIESRVKLIEKRIERYGFAKNAGAISSLEYNRERFVLHALKQEFARANENRSNVRQEEIKVRSLIQSSTMRLNETINEIEFEASKARQELLNHESNTLQLYNSLADGFVTAIQVDEGQEVRASQLLVNIVPNGANIYAELHVPSKAIGLLKVGHAVNIKLDSFPYEKFGVIRGTLSEISTTSLNPEEVGNTVGYNEPIYIGKVKLDKQNIYFNKQEYKLKSGMLLSADIILEKQNTLKSIFKPIFKLIN